MTTDHARQLQYYLETVIEQGFYDFHLAAGLPPRMIRVRQGTFHPIEGEGILSADTVNALAYASMLPADRATLLRDSELFFVVKMTNGKFYFRFLARLDQGEVSLVGRAVPVFRPDELIFTQESAT